MENKHLIRSSAAEYLPFIASTGEGGIDAIYANENIWLTQRMMGELNEYSVIQDFRITATDGKNYNTKHYNLFAIIAVGYKVNSERAVIFRKWTTQDAGKLTAEIAKTPVAGKFEKYRIIQDSFVRK